VATIEDILIQQYEASKPARPIGVVEYD